MSVKVFFNKNVLIERKLNEILRCCTQRVMLGKCNSVCLNGVTLKFGQIKLRQFDIDNFKKF